MHFVFKLFSSHRVLDYVTFRFPMECSYNLQYVVPGSLGLVSGNLVPLCVICVGNLALCILYVVGKTGYLTYGFNGTTSDPGKIALSIYSAMWAYSGW